MQKSGDFPQSCPAFFCALPERGSHRNDPGKADGFVLIPGKHIGYLPHDHRFCHNNFTGNSKTLRPCKNKNSHIFDTDAYPERATESVQDLVDYKNGKVRG